MISHNRKNKKIFTREYVCVKQRQQFYWWDLVKEVRFKITFNLKEDTKEDCIVSEPEQLRG